MSAAHVPAPQIEGYVLKQRLGTGGFSDVYLYEQQLPSRQVAVKVLHDGLSPRTATSFKDEANVMAQLSAHPSIVTIYGAGIAPDGRPYLVMEYYPKPNLYIRSRNKPLSVPDALETIIKIAGAVETAHRAGIIHRDIKPANILTSAYNKPGLTDFGISAAKSETGDGEGGLSIPWSAREVAEGVTAGDERSDVYSLTATLYSLLAGRSPFEVPGKPNGPIDILARISHGKPMPLVRSDVPFGLQRVIGIGLDPDADNRPQSAAALARLLQEVEVSMHLASTPLDVISDGHEVEDYANSDDEAATRVRGATVVRPTARDSEDRVSVIRGIPERPTNAPAAPAVAPRSYPNPPPAGAPAALTAPEQQPVAGRRKVGVAVAAGAGALITVLVTVGVGAALLSGRGSATPAPEPTMEQDPLVSDVPTPADLKIARSSATTADATWSVPDPQIGDRFQWQRTDAQGGQAVGTSDTTSLRIDGLADGDRPCLNVWLIRSSGVRSETPATACESS